MCPPVKWLLSFQNLFKACHDSLLASPGPADVIGVKDSAVPCKSVLLNPPAIFLRQDRVVADVQRIFSESIKKYLDGD